MTKRNQENRKFVCVFRGMSGMAQQKTIRMMKVEIWSDVICPFCYIGKRNLEAALAEFAGKDRIEVVWKSYLLDPTIPEAADESYESYLVKRKGMAPGQVNDMLEKVTQTAKEAGLDYRFDQAQLVSSRKAHELMHFAKASNVGDEAKELLFKAFFTEGKNIADTDTLIEIGRAIGLDTSEVEAVLAEGKYAQAVQQDIQEARQLGVQGVPFFVFDRKYAVSGAQPVQAFSETFEKSFPAWQQANPAPSLEVTQGPSCTPDGVCE